MTDKDGRTRHGALFSFLLLLLLLSVVAYTSVAVVTLFRERGMQVMLYYKSNKSRNTKEERERCRGERRDERKGRERERISVRIRSKDEQKTRRNNERRW